MRTWNFTAFFLFILLMAAAYADETLSGGIADETAVAADTAVQPPAARERIYRLSLDAATKLALANNFDIQLARYDAWIAQTDKGVAESIYDTIATAEVEYQNDQSKPTSTLAGTKSVDNDYNIGLSKKLPTGTTVSADMDNNRHWGNSSVSTSTLTHESTLGLSVTQQLGRNFLGIQDRGDIKVTLADIESTRYTSLHKIEEYLGGIRKAYWDMVLETEQVRIEEDMVSYARRLYDLNQEKLKDGLVEAPEAFASEANYRQMENNLRLAQNQFEARENVLKFLLNITDEGIRLDLTDTFAFGPGIHELAPALKDAFTYRRDYQKAKKEIEAKNLQLSMEENSLWPEISLTATLKRNGLGDHFNQSARQITDEDNADFFAGLTVTFPLENTEARARLKAAELAKAKALMDLKRIERRIAIDVIDQARACNVFKEVAVNSEEIAALQAKKLEGEEKRFQSGRSNTDTLIRFQEDLLQAREAGARARHRYQQAIEELALKTGALLDRYWKADN
jgi:outer membrane protein TolC